MGQSGEVMAIQDLAMDTGLYCLKLSGVYGFEGLIMGYCLMTIFDLNKKGFDVASSTNY